MKNDIPKTIVIIWLFAATGYVVFNEWSGYKEKGIQAAYQQGVADTVSKLIDQAQKNPCQPIDVNLQDKKIQIVDAKCLPASQTAQQPQAQSVPSK